MIARILTKLSNTSPTLTTTLTTTTAEMESFLIVGMAATTLKASQVTKKLHELHVPVTESVESLSSLVLNTSENTELS